MTLAETELSPRVFIIGEAVLTPYQSQPDQIINRPKELTDIIFSGGSTIGTFPQARKTSPAALKQFPKLGEGNMVGNFFNYDGDPETMRRMIEAHAPKTGWKFKKLKGPAEAMTGVLALKALDDAGITPEMFDENTPWLPKGESDESSPLRLALGITNSLGPYEKLTKTSREGLTEKGAMAVARGGISGNLHTGTIEALDSGGPSNLILAACATALFQIHTAARQLREDEAELVIAGGFEIAPDPVLLYILSSSRAYPDFETFKNHPQDASRPGDINSAGMVTSEGGGAFVLVTAETMRRLHISDEKILAEVAGSSIGQDPDRFVPNEKPRELNRVMTEALKKAGIRFSDLDVVIPHDTGTIVGGKHDWKSLRIVAGLPERKFTDAPDDPHSTLPDITNPKSNLGHMLAGSGAMSMIAMLKIIQEGKVSFTRNVDRPHGLVFNLVTDKVKEREINHGLIFAKGIAGETGAVVINKHRNTF